MLLQFKRRLPEMATVQERVGILETKVDGLNEKIDDVKGDEIGRAHV